MLIVTRHRNMRQDDGRLFSECIRRREQIAKDYRRLEDLRRERSRVERDIDATKRDVSLLERLLSGLNLPLSRPNPRGSGGRSRGLRDMANDAMAEIMTGVRRERAESALRGKQRTLQELERRFLYLEGQIANQDGVRKQLVDLYNRECGSVL